MNFYSLDAIIAVGYRVHSKEVLNDLIEFANERIYIRLSKEIVLQVHQLII